jgi:predicted transcriptional regulator
VKTEMPWLEKEQNLILIAKILNEAKHPTSETNVRKQFSLSKFNTEVIANELINYKLLKVYANAPVVQNKTFVISQKGHEFLRRFRKLFELLSLDPNNINSIDKIP